MGASVTTRLTVHDFLELPEEQIQRAELVDGEVVQMGFGKSRHERIKGSLLLELAGPVKRLRTAMLLSETMYVLNDTESRMPDISILLDEASRRPSPDEHFKGAPEIAIEVVSSESAAYLMTKIHAYLNHGGREVWVVYPESREVFIYTEANVARYTAKDAIETSLLPGLRFQVEELFR